MAALRIPAVDPLRKAAPVAGFMTKVALSKPGTWFYSQVAARLDPVLMRASRGRLNSALGVIPIVLLTARGARSGLKRTVPLVYFTDGDDVILMASSFGRPKFPSWYHNLKANPQVSLQAMGRTGSYLAREVQGEDRDRLYSLATNLYSGYGIYEQRTAGIRHVPVLRLTPNSPAKGRLAAY
jgi:deazaflavin-dependent oxidoreductase (nitroreductase family)